MESFNNMTKTELLCEINKVKDTHDFLKKEIIDLLTVVKEAEEKINEKLVLLDNVEENYVDLMKEFTEKE
jgi:hypothetical protein